MKARLIKSIVGIILGISAYALIWYYYDWKLALFVMLALWANNISHQVSSEQKEDVYDNEISELLKDLRK